MSEVKWEWTPESFEVIGAVLRTLQDRASTVAARSPDRRVRIHAEFLENVLRAAIEIAEHDPGDPAAPSYIIEKLRQGLPGYGVTVAGMSAEENKRVNSRLPRFGQETEQTLSPQIRAKVQDAMYILLNMCT